MDTSPTPLTQVIVLASATLPGQAWEALLASLPGIETRATVTALVEMQTLPSGDKPLTVLVDRPNAPVALVRELAGAFPNYGLLCLVDSYELDEMLVLLQAGAVGCLSRNASTSALARGLIAAGRGEIVLPPEMAARALAVLARGDIPRTETGESLTEREQEVLAHLAQGMTNKDIAQTLFLSVRTVEAHLRNIYGKLDINSRTEAALWAVQNGFAT